MNATLEKDLLTERSLALERADHSLRIEGQYSSEFAAPLFESLKRGQITPDELRAKLDAHYKRC